MAFCNKCGSALPDGANVCPKCGTPVNAGPVNAGPAPKAAPAAKKPVKGLLNDNLWNTIATIFVFVAFAFAAVAILYGFIDGIVSAVRLESFRAFISDLFSGFSRSLGYIFYGLVVTFLQKKFLK